MPRSRLYAAPTLALGVGLALAAGCRSATDAEPVLVRLGNASPYTFTAVVATFPSGERTEVQALPSGATTAYLAVREAYRYTHVEATVEGDRRVAHPIDYVGETPLAPGRYTYHLTTAPTGRGLGMELRRD